MSLFVAGTGTDVGKSFVTAALLTQLGAPWRARKPVASGVTPDDAQSDPALLARAQGSTAPVTLYGLRAPLAPDRAAMQEGVTLDWESIVDFCRGEHLLVEGAGGLFSPLTAERTNADLARALGLPLLLVAGTYLGTISHILATLRAARAEELKVAGLVLSESGAGGDGPHVQTSLRRLGETLPMFVLPRLAGEDSWRHAPDMRAWLGEALASL